jgi:hypothetical protein
MLDMLQAAAVSMMMRYAWLKEYVLLFPWALFYTFYSPNFLKLTYAQVVR